MTKETDKMLKNPYKIIQNKKIEILLFLIIPFLFILPYCFGDTIFLGTDGIQFFSTKRFYTEALLQGDFAFWNKYLMGGTPYEAYGNFYPPAFLLSLLPMDAFIITYYWFHVAFGGIFCNLFLREIKCSRTAAFVVTVLYECSIHLGGARKDHLAIITCVVYLPFILYYAQKYIEHCRFKWLIPAAIGMSMQCLTGGLQYALYTDIAVFFYILILCMKRKYSMKKLCTHIGTWVLIYIGFSMIYLFPAVMLTRQYAQGGATDNTFENFVSYSIHFYKLLMMLVPDVYGNIFQAFGIFNSSEMDIEIFLGVLVLSLIIFTVIRYRKETMVKLSIWMMVISYLYSAIGHIPILRDIVYKIPILGGFRVPARALFIFIFFGFVLLAIGLTRMKASSELEEYGSGFQKGFAGLIVLLILFVIGGSFYCHGREDLSGRAFLKYCLGTFDNVILAGLLTCLLLWIVLKNKKWSTQVRYRIWLVWLVIVTILEVLPYNMISSFSNKSVFHVTDKQTQAIQERIGNDKIWDAFCGIDGAHESIISQNLNINKRIAAINAYVPFNNPSIYQLFTNGEHGRLNYSGLLTGSMMADTNLKLQNDMLSMLGIRYIIDSSGILSNESRILDRSSEGTHLLDINGVTVPGDSDGVWVYSQEIEIKPETIYGVRFRAMTESGEKELTLDFYGGAPYDAASYQAGFMINDQESGYIAFFNSGDISTADQPIVFRIMSKTDTPIIVEDIAIYELDYAEDTPYELWNAEAGYAPIFENKNVNDILSVPVSVQQIPDRDTFFRDMYSRDLDDIAYVEADLNYDIVRGDIEISDIVFTNNRITANVNAKSKGFVMFSQCCYPGWNVYMNQEKGTVYQVSETIMGAELPPGDYVIEFVYTPIYLIGGSIMTAITVLCVIVYLMICRRNRKMQG